MHFESYEKLDIHERKCYELRYLGVILILVNDSKYIHDID